LVNCSAPHIAVDFVAVASLLAIIVPFFATVDSWSLSLSA
jgi:hypothetical protein